MREGEEGKGINSARYSGVSGGGCATATQMIVAVGASVLIRFESVEVPCVVHDVKSVYGRERLLIEPVGGARVRSVLGVSHTAGAVPTRYTVIEQLAWSRYCGSYDVMGWRQVVSNG